MKNSLQAASLGRRGQVLAGVVLIVMVLLIIVPAMVYWAKEDSKASVKDRKTAVAFNLAEAGADRAYWKLKSSTTTWANARLGISLAGYNFDQVYTDIPGGAYRISITSGPNADQVTIIAEGRDSQAKEKRAIQVRYTNMALPGGLISGATISEGGTSVVHWGPMLAMGNISLSGSAASRYFPRKLSKQVVTGTVGNPRDTNGLTPPNTDSLEWWSNYDVPELPIFDFATLRSSASATGTLNCDGSCSSSGGCTIPCGSSCTNCSIGNVYNDTRSLSNYVWYWDNNASFTGKNGIKGTMIVRGNLDIAGTDQYNPPAVHVPTNAWKEYQQFDTASTNEYPGDNGYHSNSATYDIGSCGTTCEGAASGSDVGLYGFMYVGGTINMTGDSDVYGAVWVASGWSGAGNVMIFYNDNLVLPQLNVTLSRDSWQERSPANATW